MNTKTCMKRTREALAAHDALDRAVDTAANDVEAMAIFEQIDAAKLAIGEAFALDTADRNPDHAQTASWAAFSPDRVRGLLPAIEAA
jgi:hypothetical protein